MPAESLLSRYAVAYQTYKEEAGQAHQLLKSWCAWPLPRVPGMDTVIRLAWRMAHGRTIEEAAAREYVYRWHLAIKPFDQIDGAGGYVGTGPACSIFGTPHTLGL